MPPPSPLAICTGSVQRLLKEEASYHAELAEQEAQVKLLEAEVASGGQASDDGNADFMLKQQRTAVEQTKAVFGPLKKRLDEAVAALEDQVAASEETGTHAADLEQAKSTLQKAKAA
ncbi:hypothetical protein CDD83_7051 [Cordyceps sp. RAO-2017]|nr:hypothetical protein CDD83_7051 [Cordyceps sp. RAO-2017]